MSDALTPDRSEAPKRKRNSPPATGSAKAKAKAKAAPKAKPGAAPKKTARKAAASRPGTTGQAITDQERWRLIAEEAYLRAERRGFEQGDPIDDWLSAEREVDERLRGV